MDGIISVGGQICFTFLIFDTYLAFSGGGHESLLIYAQFRIINCYTQVCIFNKCQNHFHKCCFPTLTSIACGKLQTSSGNESRLQQL